MRPLRYSINVTLDGCCDPHEMTPDPDSFQNAIDSIKTADALLFGRVTYDMMESYWRPSPPTQPNPSPTAGGAGLKTNNFGCPTSRL